MIQMKSLLWGVKTFYPFFFTVVWIAYCIIPFITFWWPTIFIPQASLALQVPAALIAGVSWHVRFEESLWSSLAIIVTLFFAIVSSWVGGGMDVSEHTTILCTRFSWNKRGLDLFSPLHPSIEIANNQHRPCRFMIRASRVVFWLNGIILTFYTMTMILSLSYRLVIARTLSLKKLIEQGLTLKFRRLVVRPPTKYSLVTLVNLMNVIALFGLWVVTLLVTLRSYYAPLKSVAAMIFPSFWIGFLTNGNRHKPIASIGIPS